MTYNPHAISKNNLRGAGLAKNTVRWTRPDMVTKQLFTCDIPVDNSNPPKVLIAVPLATYQQLVNWASVGRTIDGAIEGIEQLGGDQRFEGIIEDLSDLKPALSACHQACRDHWLALPIINKNPPDDDPHGERSEQIWQARMGGDMET